MRRLIYKIYAGFLVMVTCGFLTAGVAIASVDRARTLSGDAIGSAEVASDYSGRAASASTLEEAKDFARQAKEAADKTKSRLAEIQSELTESL